MSKPMPNEKRAAYLFSAACTLMLFTGLSGVSRVWLLDGARWLPSERWGLIAAALLLAAALIAAGGRMRRLRLDLPTCAWSLALVFLSDWLARPYALLQAPAYRGEILVAACAGPLFLRRPKLFTAAALAAPLMLAACFFVESGGRLLYADDHSAFFYRLVLLARYFPHVPFFNPFWNGGVEAREFFPSGALNAYLLAAPLFALFKPESAYNLTIALILFVLTPAATYAACRLEKLPPPVPAIAALLALANGLPWYKWALVYGTIGFITSAALLPLVVVLAARIILPDRELRARHALLAFLAVTLMILWALSAVALLPLAACALVALPTVFRKRWSLPLLVLLAVFNLPWITIFWQASNVGRFMQAEQVDGDEGGALPIHEDQAATAFKQRAGGIDPGHALALARENAHGANPLVIFLGLPGLLLLPRGIRRLYVLTALWLLMLGTLAAPLKPQLELDRMLVVLDLLLAVPAALAAARIFSEAAAERRLARTALAALTAGFMLAAPFGTAAMIRNRTLHRYRFKEPLTDQLIAAIKTAVPGDGRVLFTGCLMHELNGGHVAPLVLFTGRPLIASRYQHDIWRYRQIFPHEYLRRGDAGILEYLDLYNVSAVAAHEPKWRKWLSDRPQLFQRLWRGGSFELYLRRARPESYFLEGAGEVETQELNRVTLRLKTRDAVVKFNYLPFLIASGCSLASRQISPNVQLLRLSGCPLDTPITIEAQSPWRRFFSGGEE